VKLEAYIEFWK